jgi:D-serine deaminase-like pyridoxal phosphate-dependent protein
VHEQPTTGGRDGLLVIAERRATVNGQSLIYYEQIASFKHHFDYPALKLITQQFERAQPIVIVRGTEQLARVAHRHSVFKDRKGVYVVTDVY